MVTLSPDVKLVPIQETNIHAVEPLMMACYPPVYAHLWKDGAVWYLHETYNPAAVRKDLERNDAPYFLVQWQGENVGILWLKLHAQTPDYPDMPALKLQRIYLLPAVHGKGIGGLIMDYIVQQAQQLDKSLVWLEAMDTQETAHRFYEKMGYRKSGTYELEFTRMHPHYRGMVRMTRRVESK